MVAILVSTVLDEPFDIRKRIGFVLIVLGALVIVWGKGGTIGTAQNIGHALFLLAGFAWAGYTVVIRRARIDGLHAAAIAAVGSLAIYLPIYTCFAPIRVFKAPLFDIGLQAVVQGFLTAIVALLLYGRMVRLLGATRGAAFVALTPVVTGIMAIPVLGESPMTIDWIAIVLISGGVYVVSGGPLPYWRGNPVASLGR
jgi:drug/metabolite transporter (DMT)-like permease